MSLSDGFVQGLSTPVPVAGAGLPDDLTLYAGGPLDPLKEHEAKYKQLDRMRRMSARHSAKMLAELEKAEHQYYGDREEDPMDKVSFVSSHPLLRRQYLLKMAERPDDPVVSPPVEPPFEVSNEDTNIPFKSREDWGRKGDLGIETGADSRYLGAKARHRAYRGNISELSDEDLAKHTDKTTGFWDNFRNKLRFEPEAAKNKNTQLAHRVDTEQARRDLAKYRDPNTDEYRGISSYPSSLAEGFDPGSLTQLQDFQRKMRSEKVEGDIPRTAKEYYTRGDKGKFYPEFIRGVERRRVMLPKVQQDLEDLLARERGSASQAISTRGKALSSPRVGLDTIDSSGKTRSTPTDISSLNRDQLEGIRGRFTTMGPPLQYGRQEFGQLPEEQKASLGGSHEAYLDNQARAAAQGRAFRKRDELLTYTEQVARDQAKRDAIAKEEARRKQVAFLDRNQQQQQATAEGESSAAESEYQAQEAVLDQIEKAQEARRKQEEFENSILLRDFRAEQDKSMQATADNEADIVDNEAAKAEQEYADQLAKSDRYTSKEVSDAELQADIYGQADRLFREYERRKSPMFRARETAKEIYRDNLGGQTNEFGVEIPATRGYIDSPEARGRFLDELKAKSFSYPTGQYQPEKIHELLNDLITPSQEIEADEAEEKFYAKQQRLVAARKAKQQRLVAARKAKQQRLAEEEAEEQILAEGEAEEAEEKFYAKQQRLVAARKAEDQILAEEEAEEQILARDARLEAKIEGPPASTPRTIADARRRERGTNTAYRRALALQDMAAAFDQQLKTDPTPGNLSPQNTTTEPAPEPEKGYWDRTKGFFGDVGDSLKGMGARVVRQGTQGLQQAANYGLRNSEFLEGLVDDDEEARMLVSLAQGSTGDQRTMYLQQLEALTKRRNNPKGRTEEQQARMNSLVDNDYSALRDIHLQEQAVKRYGQEYVANNWGNGLKEEMDKDYGQAFDMYYGQGAEADRLGIKPLQDDSFRAMYDDTTNRFNAFRRAKQERSPEQKVVTDPKTVVPKPEKFKPLATIPVDDLSPDTMGYLRDNFKDIDISNPEELGLAIQDRLMSNGPEAMRALEYMATDLQPHQMNKVLMTSMPKMLTIGENLGKMTDEEAISFVNSLPPAQQEQLDYFTDFTARYIAPNVTGASMSRSDSLGNPTINRVREATDKEIEDHGSWADRAMNWGPLSYLNTQYIDESKLDQEGADVIDTELGYTGSGSGGGKWYVVPGTRDQSGSTLLFNPQTGEFNREWGGTYKNYEDLPPRYSDSLHSAFQKQEDSFLPTPGTYF
jgi:hypothetical protein